MSKESASKQQIDRFIRDEIDSVPQLEALLLFRRFAPRDWSCEDMSRELYVSLDVARDVLVHLTERRLIVEVSGSKGRYVLRYESEEKDRLLEALDKMYREELVRVSRMVHSKVSPGWRDFARAFRFKKD